MKDSFHAQRADHFDHLRGMQSSSETIRRLTNSPRNEGTKKRYERITTRLIADARPRRHRRRVHVAPGGGGWAGSVGPRRGGLDAHRRQRRRPTHRHPAAIGPADARMAAWAVARGRGSADRSLVLVMHVHLAPLALMLAMRDASRDISAGSKRGRLPAPGVGGARRASTSSPTLNTAARFAMPARDSPRSLPFAIGSRQHLASRRRRR